MPINMNAQQDDIDYIKNQVLVRFPLLGTTVSNMNFVADNSVITAATNGESVIYAPKFLVRLTDEEKEFLLAHEMLHIAFNHILRSKNRDARLWNIATDAVINQILKSEGLPIIEGGVDIPEAINCSAEEMYDKLLAEKEKQKEETSRHRDTQNRDNTNAGEQQDSQSQNNANEQQGAQDQDNTNAGEQQGAQGQNNTNADTQGKKLTTSSAKSNIQRKSLADWIRDNSGSEQVGHDSHEIWKHAVKQAEQQTQAEQHSQPMQQPQHNEPSSLSDNNSNSENNAEETETLQKEAQKCREGKEYDYEKGFLQENRAERKKQADAVLKKLYKQKAKTIQARKDAYTLGAVGNAKDAVTDWRKLLKKSIDDEKDHWSYRRANADNDYMARVEELEDEAKPETEVMLDVSGSVDTHLLKEFLRQLKPLLKTSKIKVGCFDHHFYGFTEIKSQKNIDLFIIPSQGGGTDLDLAVKSFSKDKKINKIVFTDGMGKMPARETQNINAIWVVYDNRNFSPCCGKVIYVDKKQILSYMRLANISRGKED